MIGVFKQQQKDFHTLSISPFEGGPFFFSRWRDGVMKTPKAICHAVGFSGQLKIVRSFSTFARAFVKRNGVNWLPSHGLTTHKRETKRLPLVRMGPSFYNIYCVRMGPSFYNIYCIDYIYNKQYPPNSWGRQLQEIMGHFLDPDGQKKNKRLRPSPGLQITSCDKSAFFHLFQDRLPRS